MWENFAFLVIFDTCDVVYNWFISLLPPIVLDNLFGVNMFFPKICCTICNINIRRISKDMFSELVFFYFWITTTKNKVKLYSNLIKWLETYFSKEICQKINARINNFCFHYYIEFLIFFEFIRGCRLFNNNSRKCAKIFVKNEKPE